MAATAWTVYNETKELIGKGTIKFDADTFKMALFLSTSNVANAALATAVLATATNQHANANGYTTGGAAMTTTWVRSTGTVTFGSSSSSPQWTASSTGIVCRYGVIWDDTPTSPADPLICYSTLDSTDVTVTDTNTLTISLASGIFTLT
jgi:hypothetical protein